MFVENDYKIDKFAFKTEETKKELSMRINEFNTQTEFTGLRAVAQLIINLLLMKPGTYPSSPEMGIYIKQYKFNLLDEITLKEIERNVQSQIERYITKQIPLQVSANIYKESEINMLVLAFYISSTENIQDPFFIFLKKDSQTNKLLFSLQF